jgi:hypothetical protein
MMSGVRDMPTYNSLFLANMAMTSRMTKAANAHTDKIRKKIQFSRGRVSKKNHMYFIALFFLEDARSTNNSPYIS